MVDYHEVKRSLKHFVKHILPVMEGIPPPNEDDRAFYPTDKDIQNHIYMAKRARMFSNLDQENLHLLIEKWRKECATSLHFFRPYREANDANTSDSGKHTLLWVHQEKWQRQLLMRYGNIICLLDATYKTTQYELPLFFLCMKTNVGYSVVGEFVVQSESTDDIQEALCILQLLGSHSILWLIIVRQKLVLLKIHFQIVVCMSVIFIESRRGRDGYETRNIN